MTKRTFTKLTRKFSKAKATPRHTKLCQGCGEAMLVSIGQIVFFHRGCREAGRNHNKLTT